MRRAEVLSILKAHKADLESLGVSAAYLFGSVARDEDHAGSDVDILVELSRPMGYFEFLSIQFALEKWLGQKVDLATPSSLQPRIRERVMREVVRAA
jgi:predicted nucleotidyltransferase